MNTETFTGKAGAVVFMGRKDDYSRSQPMPLGGVPLK